MSGRNGAILRVEGLTKRFGGIAAVEGCTFDVGAGSITGLIGPNGSGKTTVFNLITGFVRPDAGRVRFQEKDVTGFRPSALANRGLSRTFQITRLFRELTVLENMVAPVPRLSWSELFHAGVKHHEEAEALRWLEFVGLADYRDQPAGSLSFGQQKLLEFAALLMAKPKLILLDEPVGGVNPVMIEKMVGLIQQLHRDGVTFLIVEHNMRMVMGLCDPVVVLEHGSKIAEGPAAQVQADPRVLEAYLGD